VPGIGRAVDAFNKSHPSVCVTLEDVGAGNPEYVKITNALKAGSGAPDVAEVEFDELPSFEITHNVVDISKYGANNYRASFVPWAWLEVSQGNGVYAMPSDSGPVAFYYNSKLFAKYHLTAPKTWAQFATEAAALKKADPSAYITNFSAVDLQWIMSLMAQDNAWPFAYSGGSKVTINWTGPAQMKFAAYWQKLLSGSPAMNLYEAGLEITGDSAELVLGSQRLSLPPAVVKRASGLAAFGGGPVIVGIRPESLADPAAAGGAAEPGASLSADVHLVEVLGSEQLVHFTLDARRVRDEAELSGYGPEAGAGPDGVTATEVASGVARVGPRARVRAHGRAELTVDVERLHFFDPETGLAIG
jgi:hypothetical protein